VQGVVACYTGVYWIDIHAIGIHDVHVDIAIYNLHSHCYYCAF